MMMQTPVMNGGGIPVAGGNTFQVLGYDASKELLFNFTDKLDIGLLDSIVNAMYQCTGHEQRLAQDLLTQFKEHNDAWTRVDAILEYSGNENTKFYGLQILENLIKYRWKALPRVQCEGIRTFIVTLVIKTSQNAQLSDPQRLYLNKLNMTLVQILKREWPKNWESFISELVGSSRSNEMLCQNNMIILKLLSEEVFDFSSGQLTQTKAKHLKDTMCQEFSQIFTLCQFVLENSSNAPLSLATLETLLRFLNWIPLGYIFETELITILTGKYLPVPIFRNITMKCLTEIAGVSGTNTYDDKFLALFAQTMTQLGALLPPTINIKDAYAGGVDKDQQFIQNLALFLHTFFKEHSNLIEKSADKQQLQQALGYLLAISEVDDIEIFKICFEYWNILTAELYREAPFIPTNTSIYLSSRGSSATQLTPRRQFYSPILSQIRSIMISRMAKPEEVLVVENENGEVVREFMKDTDSINLYKNMRETLVYLTHLDTADTERIMTKKLQNQVNGSEWSWKNLNTLCWAIGSISGAMHEEDEKRFIVTVIKDLLGLCEQKKGKDNKAIIASNIMYVVGQYPRFLRAHWKFLKTVVNKLFEFMHETHDGVQDMACDTFIKIAQKCRRHFVSVQIGETNPFIEEILATISAIICDLAPQQVHTFYEAIGYMISSQTDSNLQADLIQKYMQLPNAVWDDIMGQATQAGVQIFQHPEAIKQLCSILKTNVRACKALGHAYLTQLSRLFLDLMKVYTVISQTIKELIMSGGGGNPDVAIKQPLIKNMRIVKKETLKLIGGWVSRSTDNNVIIGTFLPGIFETILSDYQEAIPAMREPEVLTTIEAIVSKLGAAMNDQVPLVLTGVFAPTLQLISAEFQENPEHRSNFYLLLQAMVAHNFGALLAIDADQFKLIYDSLMWGIQHTMRNVADVSLNTLHVMFTKFVTDALPQQRQGFFQNYYLDIIKRIFTVLVDSSHSASLSMHAQILSYLFNVLENGALAFPILPQSSGSPADNVALIKQFVAESLKAAFPHLTENQLKLTVNGMFNLDADLAGFKEHLRDFLVQTREFSGADDSDLFYEERENALKQAETEKRQLNSQVPGILNPHEIVEEMQD